MRIRLKTRFFYLNHLYEPGDVVVLAAGVPGPTTGGLGAPEPLFDVVEGAPASEAEPQPVALIEAPDPAKTEAAAQDMAPAKAG